jgi:hypothetical protein
MPKLRVGIPPDLAMAMKTWPCQPSIDVGDRPPVVEEISSTL